MEDIAWFAGLFEGEGNIYRNDKRRQLILSVKMKDEDIIRRLQKITDSGHIHLRRLKYPYAPMWDWSVTKTNDILRITNMILPFMGERRTKQILNALDGKHVLPEKRVLKLVPSCNYILGDEVTTKGAKKHYRAGEKPCSRCAKAYSSYLKRWRKQHFEANP